MKNLFLISILFLSLSLNAQHYIRTKYNFGITTSYNFIDNTRLHNSNQAIEQGKYFALGLTHVWKDFFYPELFFSQHQRVIPTTFASELAPSSFKLNGLGTGLTAKLDLFTFDRKKKNGYCFERILNLIVGGAYVYNFDINSNQNLKILNEANGKIGLGMYSCWGGSSKKNMAWTIHWEGYYKYGFTPFLNIQNYSTDGSAQTFEHSSVGVTLRVMYHKTYRFSEM